MRDSEDNIEEMEMPCVCTCNEVVELSEMNPCEECNKRYCEECCPEVWGVCVYCK